MNVLRLKKKKKKACSPSSPPSTPSHPPNPSVIQHFTTQDKIKCRSSILFPFPSFFIVLLTKKFKCWWSACDYSLQVLRKNSWDVVRSHEGEEEKGRRASERWMSVELWQHVPFMDPLCSPEHKVERKQGRVWWCLSIAAPVRADSVRSFN